MLPDPTETKTKGGVHLPQQHTERMQAAAETGVLIAMGEMAFTVGNPRSGEFHRYETKPRPGQRVSYARYAGVTVKGADGADYRLMNDDNVTAILETDNG